MIPHRARHPRSQRADFYYGERLRLRALRVFRCLDGILNYCRTKGRFGVVEAINSNIKTLFRNGRGYKNLGYLLLKAQRMAVTKTEFIVLQKAA